MRCRTRNSYVASTKPAPWGASTSSAQARLGSGSRLASTQQQLPRITTTGPGRMCIRSGKPTKRSSNPAQRATSRVGDMGGRQHAAATHHAASRGPGGESGQSTRLTPNPAGYRYLHPDFVRVVFVAEASSHLPEQMVQNEYVVDSVFRPIAEALELPLPASQRHLGARTRPQGPQPASLRRMGSASGTTSAVRPAITKNVQSRPSRSATKP